MRAAALGTSLIRPGRVTRQFAREVTVVHYPLTLGVPWADPPTIVSLHDVQHQDLPEHFSAATRLARRVLYDAPARRATLVVTLSEHSKRRIVARLGIDPAHVTVIPLAADHGRFRPAPDPRDEQLAAELRLPARFVFYPATLWPHKNHLRLFDAFARVADLELHLLLCGAPFGRLEEIRAAAAARGVGARVRHLGFVADDALPAIYRRATALVFPSTYEGFGDARGDGQRLPRGQFPVGAARRDLRRGGGGAAPRRSRADGGRDRCGHDRRGAAHAPARRGHRARGTVLVGAIGASPRRGVPARASCTALLARNDDGHRPLFAGAANTSSP